MNPQMQTVLQMLKAATPPDAPRLWDMSPSDARASMDGFLLGFNAGGPTMDEIRELAIPGRRGAIRARLYVPRGSASIGPALLYLHGGGFVLGSPETHDRLTRELAEGLEARVVSLHYALAPEHPYPAGLEDCVDAARWLATHGRDVGIDPERLLIGGDSAGANLGAATVLKLRDEGTPGAFRAALLLYGRFAEGTTPSLDAWGERDLILSRRLMEWFRALYVPDGVRPGDPYYAPLGAELVGFPPAALVVGTLDPLLSDSELFAQALENAGVPAELHVVEDGIHAFAQMPMLDMAGAAIARLCAFGRERLATRDISGAGPRRPGR
jgi:acetyl esterase